MHQILSKFGEPREFSNLGFNWSVKELLVEINNFPEQASSTLTINFQLGCLGVAPAWCQLVVSSAEVFSSVRLLHLRDGQSEGHVTVIREHGLLFEVGLPGLITGAPGHSVLTIMISYHYRGNHSLVLPDWVGVNDTAEHSLLILINYHVRGEADHPATTTFNIFAEI